MYFRKFSFIKTILQELRQEIAENNQQMLVHYKAIAEIRKTKGDFHPDEIPIRESLQPILINLALMKDEWDELCSSNN